MVIAYEAADRRSLSGRLRSTDEASSASMSPAMARGRGTSYQGRPNSSSNSSMSALRTMPLASAGRSIAARTTTCGACVVSKILSSSPPRRASRGVTAA